MFDFLEKIRSKSEKTKKIFAFSVSLFVAGLIFVIWISVIYPDFRNRETKSEKVAQLEPSPISTFGDTVATAFSAMGEQFGQMKNMVSELASTTTAHYSSAGADIMATSTEPVSTTTSADLGQ